MDVEEQKIETDTTPTGTDAVVTKTETPLANRKRKRTLGSDDEDEPPKKTVKAEQPAKIEAAPADKPATPKVAKVETPKLPAKVETPKLPAKATPKPAVKSTPPKRPSPNKRKRLSSSSESDSSSDSSGSSDSDSSTDSDSSSGSESSTESSSDDKRKKKTPVKKTPVKKAPAKKETPTKSAKKETPTKKETKASPAKRAKKETGDVKKEKKDKKLTDEAPDDVWWKQKVDESYKNEDGKKNWKWKTLEHNGICFPPPYVPHGVKMLYDKKKVDLTPDQEEVATFFARYMETDHVKKPQFSKNFFTGFKSVLGKNHVIKEFSKCDFTPILNHLKNEKEKRKDRTKEEKLKEKKEKEEMKEKYGYAKIDGRREALGNYMVEPPSLFLGRGDHPKSGTLKLRVHPKDVTLNLSEEAKVPLAPNGQKYGAVVHNHEVAWVAFWRPNISDSPKYVLFSANSSLRGKSDLSKFDKAKRLGENIDKIRKTYMAELTSDDRMTRQRATALWIIDHLALRVGGEKSDDEADTVGCCSLRIEHMTLHAPKDVEFDFLGKDSMRYHNRVAVDPKVFKNLQKFMKGKKKNEDVFDLLGPPQLNAHLKSLMPGLTAKVFRTYNASVCMQAQLDKWDSKKNDSTTADEKLLFFNASSVEVAILCNHKRAVAQTFVEAMGKLDEQIKEAQDDIKEIEEHRKALKAGKSPKKRTKKNKDGEEEEKPMPSSIESCDKKIEALKSKIARIETKKKDKDQQKEISTSTSKVNYIDPRISITWCNKVGLDVSKIFAKTLRDKFGWAFMECEKKPKFRF